MPRIKATGLVGLGDELGALTLLVNATPVGMYPEVGVSPWPSELEFPTTGAVYDMVYNPERTKLIRDASSRGLPTRNGLGMLVEQAALAFEAWTGVKPSRQAMWEAAGE
jgi:shikimate dehydrogenase